MGSKTPAMDAGVECSSRDVFVARGLARAIVGLAGAAMLAGSLSVSGCRRPADEELARGAGQARLSGADVKRDLVGSTIHGTIQRWTTPSDEMNGGNAQHVCFYERYATDGTVRYREGSTCEAARSSPAIPGTFRVLPDGTLCTRLSPGAESCERVYVVRRKFFGYRADGTLHRTFLAERGNTLSM